MPPEISIVVFAACSLGFYALASLAYGHYEEIQQALLTTGKKKDKQRKVTLSMLLTPGNRKYLALGLAVIGGLIGLNFHIGTLGVFGGAVIMGGFPIWFMSRKETKRRLKIESQVVSTLTMMANTMRAGKTLAQAIDDVSHTAEKPMANELAFVSRQIMVGIQPAAALEDFQERVNTPDIKLAVRAMLVSITTGADLPEAIERINKTILSRSKVEGKIRTLTTQGKMQGMILGLAPLVLLIAFYLMSPDYMGIMFNTIQGNIVLGLICTLQIIAFIAIRKIVTIKV